MPEWAFVQLLRDYFIVNRALRSIFDRFHCKMDVDAVAEAQWGGELALGPCAWPAHQFARLRVDQIDARGFEEVTLRGFHVFKEIREMHESCHVGLGEFNAARGSVFVCHAAIH